MKEDLDIGDIIDVTCPFMFLFDIIATFFIYSNFETLDVFFYTFGGWWLKHVLYNFCKVDSWTV